MAKKSTIVVATNNPGKLKEFAMLLPDFQIISQTSLDITPEEEVGETFFENSLQKARVANNASGMSALGDDSGLIVPVLNHLPGLRSARYAHENATDDENRQYLKTELEKLNLTEAAIKLSSTLFESPIQHIFNFEIGFFFISSTVNTSDKT